MDHSVALASHVVEYFRNRERNDRPDRLQETPRKASGLLARLVVAVGLIAAVVVAANGVGV